MTTNLFGQSQWERRGENDARLASLETTLALVQTGAWTAHTPTFSNITVGDGTRAGYYLRIGRLITYRGSLTIGSTTSVTGFIYINLPIAARDTSYVGAVYANNDGHNSGVLVPNSVNDAFPIVGTAHMGTSTPATWSTGEYFIWDVTYEAVS